MPIDSPVNFGDKAREGRKQNGAGYPHQLSAEDLDKNFAYGLLDGEDAYFEEIAGPRGYTQRRLTLPLPPTTGTHVLGVIDGVLTWIATEECD